MRRKKWLVFRILDLLAMLENDKNRPTINQIKGYLFSLIDED